MTTLDRRQLIAEANAARAEAAYFRALAAEAEKRARRRGRPAISPEERKAQAVVVTALARVQAEAVLATLRPDPDATQHRTDLLEAIQ